MLERLHTLEFSMAELSVNTFVRLNVATSAALRIMLKSSNLYALPSSQSTTVISWRL